jgi:hypothetical protein
VIAAALFLHANGRCKIINSRDQFTSKDGIKIVESIHHSIFNSLQRINKIRQTSETTFKIQICFNLILFQVLGIIAGNQDFLNVCDFVAENTRLD